MVTDALNTEQCISQCMDSRNLFGISCQSGMMYFQETQLNCILNTVTASTNPDVFTTTVAEQVDYFEIGCNAGPPNGDRMKGEVLRQNILGSSTNTWGAWSPCDLNAGVERRFRNCNGNGESVNPNACDVEERPCPTTLTTTTTKPPFVSQVKACNVFRGCCALRVGSGKYDCAHGITLQGGRRLTCTNVSNC
jgi:hypothetical protein